MRINKGTILDCYEYCKSDECWASYANSATNIIPSLFPHTPRPTANAKLVIRGNCAFLVALDRVILPGEEILIHYGSSYKYC